jgi:hypothetical protein
LARKARQHEIGGCRRVVKLEELLLTYIAAGKAVRAIGGFRSLSACVAGLLISSASSSARITFQKKHGVDVMNGLPWESTIRVCNELFRRKYHHRVKLRVHA